MDQSILFWKEYLNIYCINHGQTGMTVPNIVGSVRLNTNLKEYSIHDFLEEVLLENYEILISFCRDIDELVIGKFKVWHAPKNYYQNIGSIYFSKSDFQVPIEELSSLTLEFQKLYNIRIEDETYSKDEQTKFWIYLSSEDKQNHQLVIENLNFK